MCICCEKLQLGGFCSKITEARQVKMFTFHHNIRLYFFCNCSIKWACGFFVVVVVVFFSNSKSLFGQQKCLKEHIIETEKYPRRCHDDDMTCTCLGNHNLGCLVRESPSWVSEMILISMRTYVWSLASLSGLRIQRCHELWCRSKTWLRSRAAVAMVYRLAAVALIWPLDWELP